MRAILRTLMLTSLAATICFSCGATAKKERPALNSAILTEQHLLEINDDTRFITFFYGNSKTEAGILLRWKPDSILIQSRGQGMPHYIPSYGITQIEVVTGNKSMNGLAWGTLVAAAYAGAVRIDKINGITFLSAVGKLLVPPAILVAGVAIGASRETKELYNVPPDFIFDYDLSKRQIIRKNQ